MRTSPSALTGVAFRRRFLLRDAGRRRRRGCFLPSRAIHHPWRRSSGRGTPRRGGRRRRTAPAAAAARSTTHGRRGSTSRTPSRCSSSAPAFSCKQAPTNSPPPPLARAPHRRTRRGRALFGFAFCYARLRLTRRLQFLRVRKGLPVLGKVQELPEGYHRTRCCNSVRDETQPCTLVVFSCMFFPSFFFLSENIVFGLEFSGYVQKHRATE